MNYHFRQNRNQEGFTLLEILLVLVVLSLVSIAVISSLPSGGGRPGNEDAQTFYQRVQLLQEDAMLSGRTYGVLLSDVRHQIQFLIYERGKWRSVPESMMNSELSLSDSVSVIFRPGGSVWLNKERLYDPEAENEKEFLSSDDDEKKTENPQIVIYPNGMISAFELTFKMSETVIANISVANDGQLILGGVR
ncbi:prepilin-type N-terminal cleavage/methylation domain-containing protein [Vibrio salinus]|uniref:prepilin-type N-terminal cleavage/methylation domain-containing protein n=1 Tax=Vibrio salinus TaxID=2899784 RepID=UPI001E4EDCDF|nr:GspH/FimT family pseudopilin [Vibrio salinus]MCE0493857.1 GspH/FimT family pseudopilin [Vibrio salinus]